MRKFLLLLLLLLMLPVGAPQVEYLNVAVSDLNGDGNPDIVGAHQSRGIHVWLSDGKGNFIPSFCPASSGYWRDVAVADVDGDGMPDIVAGGEGGLSVFAGGSFKMKKKIEGAFEGVAVADLDEDGKAEIVAGGERGLFVFNNELKLMHELSRKFVRQMAVGDLDGDGFSDIVATTRGWGISIFYKREEGYEEKVVGRGGYYDVILEDLDSDGRPDILASSTKNGFQVYMNKSNFLLTDYVVYKYWGMALEDMDGDGIKDAIGASDGFGIHVWLGKKEGGFSNPQNFPSRSGNFWGIVAEDMDGDEFTDIVAGNEFGGVDVFFMGGANVVRSIELEMDCEPFKQTGIGIPFFLSLFLLKMFINARRQKES